MLLSLVTVLSLLSSRGNETNGGARRGVSVRASFDSNVEIQEPFVLLRVVLLALRLRPVHSPSRSSSFLPVFALLSSTRGRIDSVQNYSLSFSAAPSPPHVVLSPREIDCGLGTKLPGGTVYATVIDAPTPNASHVGPRAIVTRYPAWPGPQSAATLALDRGDSARPATANRPCIARALRESCIEIRRTLPDLVRAYRAFSDLASVLHLVSNLAVCFSRREGLAFYLAP